jgi:hypothetical protein
MWNTEKELVAAADRALYEAKGSGRDCVKAVAAENLSSPERKRWTSAA